MKLGILGGMGPYATVCFYERLVKKTPANSDQEHIDTLILSHASMPDRTSVILNGDSTELFEAVKGDLSLFEAAGCKFIAIPCNTFHYFYKDVAAMTDIEVLNMVETAVEKTEAKFGKGSKIAVLGTNGTIRSGVYKEQFKKSSLTYYELDEKRQESVMDVIYKVKSTNIVKQPLIDELIEELIKTGEVDGIILACTELSSIEYDTEYVNKTVDAMDELVDLAIRKCLND